MRKIDHNLEQNIKDEAHNQNANNWLVFARASC